MKHISLSLLLICVACNGTPRSEPGQGEPPPETALTVLSYQTDRFVGPALTVLEPPFGDGIRVSPAELEVSAVGVDYRGEELLILSEGERSGETYVHQLYSRANGVVTEIGALELPFAASGFSVSGELVALTDAPGKVLVIYNLTSEQIEETTVLDDPTVAIDMLSDTLYGVTSEGVTLRTVDAPSAIIRTIALENSRIDPPAVRGLEAISETTIFMMDSNSGGPQLLRLEVQGDEGTDTRVAGFIDLQNVRALTAAP